MPALPPVGGNAPVTDSPAESGKNPRIPSLLIAVPQPYPCTAAGATAARRTYGMNKNILVISTSPRKNGNSALLAEEFARGAADAGHQVEIITLRDKNIGFCRGCLSCVKTQRCVIQDDAAGIIARMKQADVIAFATPVYYFEMSGQMKTLLDRSNPLYTSDYAFRDIYLLASAAENDDSAVDGPINGLKGWIACFEKCAFKGAVRGVGATAPGDIRQHTAVLEAAYKMGRQA